LIERGIMNGSESLVRTLVASGIDVCFANPGTSEMHFVAALDKVDGIRPILCLFEGVCTGAADGYGRMTGRPAMTLLHLGPGLANGLANLHNARRAQSPILNIVGDHATYHGQFDSPLASDVMGFARPVSAWLLSSPSAKTIAADGARAVQAARHAQGQIATLILPADTAWLEADRPAPPLPVIGLAEVDGAAIDQAVAALRCGKRVGLLLGGAALRRRGLEAAGRIAAATGVRLVATSPAARFERGAGLVPVERIPYSVDQAIEMFKQFDMMVIAGGKAPVANFAYPGRPSWLLPPECGLVYLSHQHEDSVAALEVVAAALGAPKEPAHRLQHEMPDRPSGTLDPMALGKVVARHLPENAIQAEETATSAAGLARFGPNAAPHDVLSITGGAIGQGMPVATGAAVACPDRKVVCIQGDGGGMYTLQALWTQARERLDVTTVICANRSYAILAGELARVGASNAGPKALSMLDLHDPVLDWVSLAKGMGVEASRAETAEAFDAQFASAMRGHGPRLIEAVLAP
jgi:acetolactate synthase I/II/III large subunit